MSKKKISLDSKFVKKLTTKKNTSLDLFSKLRLTKWGVIISFILSIIVSLLVSYFINLGPINPQKYSVQKNIEIGEKINKKDLECKYTFKSDYIKGPESLVYNKERNSIFTGSKNGSIIELDVNTLKTKKVYSIYNILYNNNNIKKKYICDGTYYTISICGRPLGLQFGVTPKTSNILYIADGIFGIYSLNLDTQKITILINSEENTTYEKRKKMYGNDLIVTKSGIYFSISSTKFDDNQYLYDILEHSNNGKIMYYDFENKKISEIIGKLYFPNGIQMIKDNKVLLVSEMSKMRIIKINLEKNNNVVINKFIEYLPGYVDNIRIIKNNNNNELVVPIPYQVTYGDEFFANYPGFRRMLSAIFQYPIMEKFINYFSNSNSLIQYYNVETGEYLRTINIPFKGLSVSHVLHLKFLNIIYFGSDNGDYIYACQIDSNF
ncbi:Six-bladed beta-propeller, TolB-like domain and Strictosidine synthase, conserved region domain-containing protein [Strongyloides ratti]|uniref:Six-bladed beta-propeller, TolB-like domain and Strictosidine synthase, conserved region domain-containing protein n=1 Tax=Strongyloides ratti TaxID=34506 RepID=A0A090KV47_STRRB|nr:Six-bladed beta-propeller, TolB-like domain and Strictosidine synthase, conserved region domain-containing protein [Strongyloides ratti]CEF59705.1 Six-bladed beta-propeller, TolB-like domain and Strictosidine synthase, conserved region domain-containing protein [Strongyloides ratti]